MAKPDRDRRARAAQQLAERRRVALEVYQDCDAAIDRELGELATRGVTPTCARGCAHCCRQVILTTRAEAEAVVAHVTAHLDAAAQDALRARVAAWLAWYRAEYPALIARGVSRHMAFYGHGPQCPALDDGACAVYPARPITCRNHFVTTPPDACRPANDPRYLAVAMGELPSVVRVTQGASMKLRNAIEKQGADFFATVHLLPEWLAHLLGVESEPWKTLPPPFERPR